MPKRLSILFLIVALIGTTFVGFVQGAQLNDPPQVTTSYREVVKKVLPAVVQIQSDVKNPSVRRQLPKEFPFDPKSFDFPQEFRKFFGDSFFNDSWFEDFRQQSWKENRQQQLAIPKPYSSRGFGSGFVVDPNGIIVTNHHVVAGADRVRIKFHDGTIYTSEDMKSDPSTDLAIIRITPKKSLAYLEWANSDEMEIGDKVLAVGAPFGLVGSVTHGIISGSHRTMGVNRYEDFIQTDAAINPGNSGGPLVNLQGKVIGVNSAIKTRTGSFHGVGMAISSKLAKQIMGQLLEKGVVQRGYLGVQIRNLDPRSDEVSIRQGALVVQVVPDSPADQAGIQVGDIITKVNDQLISNANELQHSVVNLPIDKEATFQVYRNGKEQSLTVKLKEQPKNFERLFGLQTPRTRFLPSQVEETIENNAGNMERLGLQLADLDHLTTSSGWFNTILGSVIDAVQQATRKAGVTGALITEVEPGSLSAMANIQPGMWIVKVNDQSVKSAAEAREAIEQASLSEGIRIIARDAEGGVHQLMLRSNF